MLINSRALKGRCPVCGEQHAACGPPSEQAPADQRIEEVSTVSGPLKLYRVTVGGNEAVLQLNEQDAAAMDAVPVEGDEPEPAPAKKRTAANKARTAANKGAGGGG